MNYSVFITQGVALHATTSDHIAELGRPTSGGCVRLAPENAQKVYGWVAKYGAKNTTIIVK
jgi:lipoprotein-anchoring transpeptidase ErfK/SrfK